MALRLQSPSATFQRNNYVVTSALVIDDFSGCGVTSTGMCSPLHQIPLPTDSVSLPSNVTMGRLARSADGGSVTFIAYNSSAGSALGPNDNLAASLVSLWPSGSTVIRTLSFLAMGAGSSSDSGMDANAWANSAVSDDGTSNVWVTGEKVASSLGLLFFPQLNGSAAVNVQGVNGFKVSSAGGLLFFLASPESVVVLNSAQRVTASLQAAQFLPAFSAAVST